MPDKKKLKNRILQLISSNEYQEIEELLLNTEDEWILRVGIELIF